MFRMLNKFVFILCAITVFASPAFSESSSLNLALPSIPGNYQYDKFRSGELDCQNAIGSATTMEFGVMGTMPMDSSSPGYYDNLNNYINNGSNNNGNVGVYARIIIPLGARATERINCNALYELELQKKRLEVMKLERELQQLRALQFEN